MNKMKKQHIKKIDFALIVVTLLVLASFIGYARPLVIAPLDDLATTNGSVLFEFERGNIILIDDNAGFNSPREIHAEENLLIHLKPGKYYWKVKGVLGSEIRELTILSEVSLKLKKLNDKFGLVNTGNVELDVEIYEYNSLVEKVVLDVLEEKEVSGTKFVGGQHE